MSDLLHLGVALDGAGWHPAAWRAAGARPGDLFQPEYWVDLVAEAERGLLDFVSFEDGFGLAYPSTPVSAGAGERTDRVRGRFEAVLLAARVAVQTYAIGIVPTATTTHTEPFHVSASLATLDYVSGGRAGWQAQASLDASEAAHVGRRALPAPEVLFEEAALAVDAVRALWDSWEDDAIIRDEATAHFLDRDKLHYVDVRNEFFAVKGPSIVPRPPQGQLPVAVLARTQLEQRFAASSADLVFTTPQSASEAAAAVASLRAAEAVVARSAEPIRVYADLAVFLEVEPGAAARRLARLDALDGEPFRSEAQVFAGTPEELADLMQDWRSAGIDGFRLRPGVLPVDLAAITGAVVPLLQARGLFRASYEAGQLRGLLGLDPSPANRFA
jgi:alkanesulfonate monooxygenase SsuD/methylene tetrahydromethanopterin reductase-like flavin-dependent oxidoreductase (luciferase family)